MREWEPGFTFLPCYTSVFSGTMVGLDSEGGRADHQSSELVSSAPPTRTFANPGSLAVAEEQCGAGGE